MNRSALQPPAVVAGEVAPVMVRIPGGFFQMGSADGPDNERPVHTVWVNTFDLAVYSVTNALYAPFLTATGQAPPRFWETPGFADPDQPVVGVSWFDAVAYCAWLSAARGLEYRLPTEAEREKAARGGREGERFPWGNDEPAREGRYALGTGQDSRPWRVGLGEPNGYGLYNMAANVHEWCADYYAADYYTQAPFRNPPGPATGARRVARGGSWRHHVKVTRCAARSSLPPDRRFGDFGFRVACTVPAPPGTSSGEPSHD